MEQKDRGLCPVCSALTKGNCGQMRGGLNRVQKREKKDTTGMKGIGTEKEGGGGEERNDCEWFRRLERESRITTTFPLL